MYYIMLTREGTVEAVWEATTDLQQKISVANQEAGFLHFITEENAAEHLNAVLAYAQKQKLRADNAEMRLDEYCGYDE